MIVGLVHDLSEVLRLDLAWNSTEWRIQVFGEELNTLNLMSFM